MGNYNIYFIYFMSEIQSEGLTMTAKERSLLEIMIFYNFLYWARTFRMAVRTTAYSAIVAFEELVCVKIQTRSLLVDI